MKRIALALVLGAPAALLLATPVFAQATAPNDHDRIDQQLSSRRAAMKAAIRSGDAKRTAAEHAKLRTAYGADWRDDHPRQLRSSGTATADQRLAVEKGKSKAAYKSGNKAAIASERAKLSAAYAEANRAHKRR